MLKIATLAILYTTAAIAITQWKYVPSDASIKFTVYEKGGTEQGVFTGITGGAVLDTNSLAQSSITASIQVSTINTGVDMRDEVLKSKDFFEVAKYPSISFASTKITKTPKGYLATGVLTAKQVTKPISIPFAYTPKGADAAVLKGSFTINRLDYGIGSKTDGVGTKVKIDLEIPIIK